MAKKPKPDDELDLVAGQGETPEAIAVVDNDEAPMVEVPSVTERPPAAGAVPDEVDVEARDRQRLYETFEITDEMKAAAAKIPMDEWTLHQLASEFNRVYPDRWREMLLQRLRDRAVSNDSMPITEKIGRGLAPNEPRRIEVLDNALQEELLRLRPAERIAVLEEIVSKLQSKRRVKLS